MTGPTRTDWRLRLLVTGFAAAFVLVASAMASPSAHARVWVSIGGPCCGYYPGPYYDYPPPPYAYAPPPGYYPPPPDYGAPGPGAYPPSASAYMPGAPTPGYPPPSGAAGAGYAPPSGAPTAASPGITYTTKPAFTNASGQTCRQYKTTDTTGGHPIDVYGTACRQADGQWRVVN